MQVTIDQPGEATIEINKSVFIAHSAPVSTSKEAISFVEKIKSQYPDARHNCYAWLVDDKEGKMQKFSDDKEPQGTAGLPILSCMTKRDITNAVVVVTRYFGGILLGKGGLVRAYTEAATAALINSQIVTLTYCSVFSLRVSYSLLDKVIFEINNHNWKIDEIKYETDVVIKVFFSKDDEEDFVDIMNEKTAGSALIEKITETNKKLT